MNENFPKVSIITATLNAAPALRLCYEAVSQQDYPQNKMELIIGDGGSTDNTRQIAESYGAKIAPNPLKTAEAGKAAALKLTTGELILILDSDNIIPNKDWLRNMVAPFTDTEIAAAEPWDYTYRKPDSAWTRYFALIGMNDPLCLFLGNYDRRNFITNKWTGLPVKQVDAGGYIKASLTEETLPTIGANGFMIRKSEIIKCSTKKYVFDIDLLHELLRQKNGQIQVAKVKVGIVHLYVNSFNDFVRKQRRRVRDFLYFRKQKETSATGYPWMKLYFSRLIIFILSCLSFIPLLIQMIIGYLRQPDPAWWYHIPACWATLVIYGWEILVSKIFGARPASRTNWKQTT